MFAFSIFLAINFVLFLRPAEIFQDLAGWPIYESLMIAGMVLTVPDMLRQLTFRSIRDNPITACVLTVFGSILVATTLKVSSANGYDAAIEFSRNVIFYLMLTSVISTSDRLRTYLIFLAFCFLILALLPLGQEYGIINIASMHSLEQRERNADGTLAYTVQRLQGIGIFNDPNDLAVILVAGLAFAEAFRRFYSYSVLRVLWIPMCIPMAAALVLTHSRGGMAAFLAALTSWIGLHYGWWRAIYLSAIAAPSIVFVVGGRVSQIDGAMSHGTGQSRLQIWSNGIGLIRANFPGGIGYQQTTDLNDGLVLHNTFLECFLELGFVGGAAFLGAVTLAVVSLARSPIYATPEDYGRLASARAALFSSIVGTTVGLLFVSRQYTVTPYLFLGLSAVWCRQAGTSIVWPEFQTNWLMCRRLAGTAICMLGVVYFVINTFARFS